MDGLKDLSEIEQLKMIKSMCLGFSTNEEIKNLVDSISKSNNLDPTETMRRLKGLLLEDEFILLCDVMASCNFINGIEQGLSFCTESQAPDFLSSFKITNNLYDKERVLDGLGACIEVKTTDKFETSKLSNKVLEKHSQYARKLRLPLLMAARLTIGDELIWVMQTESQFKKSNRRSSVKAISDGVAYILLNDFEITATQDISVRYEWSKEPINSTTRSPEYGYLKELTIETAKQSLTLPVEHLFASLLIDSFGKTFVKETPTKNGVFVDYKINAPQGHLLSSLLLRANYHTLTSCGAEYTHASRLLALQESGKTALIKRDVFHRCLNILNSNELIFMVSLLGAPESSKLIDLLCQE
jgi:hypothetical protein